ncbi:hypothetical protein DFH07DRAFT_1033699 [Mycena maculata]|uniref:Cytochrome P450 n=1 Tax=Mycena maculata TaxID=230809 RepID=A0AAD7NX62_9AGAR|nr:hypothetical protein DFH07DRAFT_1033699 [Mycena maculata]
MPTIPELYGICICTAILIFLILTHFCIFFRRCPIHHRTPADIHLLLDPPTVSTNTLLHSRASPNTRLHRAFELTNTFVSADPFVHSGFVKKSIALLRAAKDWKAFTGIAVQAVELSLPDSTTPFPEFVRSATLRTIVVGLLDHQVDSTYLDAHDVGIVADSITDIWLLSKKPDPIPQHRLAMLNTHLRRLIPDQDEYPNPLDFVIPAWETLWRLVAATLAHIHTDTEACRAFDALLKNPRAEQFRADRLDDTAPSVENYINESLRLYPPVRHITRHIFRRCILTHFLPRFLAARLSPRIDIEVADIESAQRSVFWGSDPDTYDPTRFLRAPDLAKEVLAFGNGPLKCKAAHWAPMAAALIVGAILGRVDGTGHHFVRGERIGGRVGWDGWLVQRVDGAT